MRDNYMDMCCLEAGDYYLVTTMPMPKNCLAKCYSVNCYGTCPVTFTECCDKDPAHCYKLACKSMKPMIMAHQHCAGDHEKMMAFCKEKFKDLS